jgi:protein gp37
MGQTTGIQWCHHTFNAVWGCTKVDRGCQRCYAETFSRRVGLDVWGPATDYRVFGDSHWSEPFAWNAAARASGERRRCFGGSMCDPFDVEWPQGTHGRLWDLIRRTGSLDWLLLTKRPENIPHMLPSDWGYGFSNVWILVSAHDQESLVRRAKILAGIPAIVRGISLEPLVGDDIDLRALNLSTFPDIHWLIIGGESGSGAAPMPLGSVSVALRQAKAAKLPVFFKQFGSVLAREYGWSNRKGEDPTEWPKKYVQQFPLTGVRRCIGCGCHNLHACSWNCHWVEKSLCSACAGDGNPTPTLNQERR